jgi:hypothetical protein
MDVLIPAWAVQAWEFGNKVLSYPVIALLTSILLGSPYLLPSRPQSCNALLRRRLQIDCQGHLSRPSRVDGGQQLAVPVFGWRQSVGAACE